MSRARPEPPPAAPRRLAEPVAPTLAAAALWAERAQEFCVAEGIAADTALQVALVFEELLTNSVRHGGVQQPLEASLEIRPDELQGEVSDDGAAFDPLQAPSPDLAASLEERAIGGLGIHLVRSLTDELGYERRDGRNRLRFVKRLTAGA